MKTLVAGILIGFLLLGLARFTFAPAAEEVHYHANFAVFVDGRRMDLTADRYMEDVAACGAGGQVRPRDRAHLHDNDHDVVHVHHAGVTWGHFFANLGFGLGEDYLITDTGARYFSGPERTLKFVVNGLAVPSVHDRLIRPNERLLVSYGAESADDVIRDQFPVVADDAARYDTMSDPGACGAAEPRGAGARLRAAFWW